MNRSYDVAVIGSGFAGSLLAMIARRQGRSVVLIEKDKHPRFAIGESSTPLSNLLLEDLARRYDLPGIAPLSKWGTWRRAYPDLDCGLKRGFTFYHHTFGARAATTPGRENQLLVAASPHDGIADTHWHRASVDAHFVREAQSIGVEYFDEVRLSEAVERDDAVTLLGTRRQKEISISARFVVDATGPRGFLHRAFSLPEIALPGLPATQGLYTHFRGVRRMEDLLDSNAGESPDPGPLDPVPRRPVTPRHISPDLVPPYPVDDAAVHHVFDGGWIWVLRFRSGIASAGVAMRDSLAAQMQLAEGAPAWERLMQSLPTLRDQFAAATPERPFIHAPRLSFRSGVIAGRRWALLPSAAGFVDPLLSTGFPLVLLGVTRLAAIMNEHWDNDRFSEKLSIYARQTDEELLATARLIGSLYANLHNFPLFVSLSMIYFAAASFAETARRLEKPHLASSFLLHDHPAFQSHLPDIFRRAQSMRGQGETEKLTEDILRLIEPINIAGLGNPERRNWYPVDPDDLLRGAPKVEASQEEIDGLLERCGLRNAPPTL